MFNEMKKISILLVVFVSIIILPVAFADSTPDWVKNTAGWWATDAISEDEFVNAIEFLINEEIIDVSASSNSKSDEGVPDWVKNTAGWWATDAISEDEFVNSIEFLVNVGIIQIESESKCVEYISNFFNNKQKIIQACEEHEFNTVELIPYQSNLDFNSKGFRVAEFSEEKSFNTYRIFMVGGSTLVGSGLTNDTTIPTILQKMFDKQNLDLEIEVINAGISGGNTKSELELIKTKIINYNPDLVILYDGWNDLSADYPVEITTDRWNDVCTIGYEEKFEVIVTLQPIAGFGNKILTQQEKINSLTGQDHNGYQLIQGKPTYDWLARQLHILGQDMDGTSGKGVCETYDFRDAFDNVDGAIYWDQGHVLQTGNLILAEKFFEITMKKIDPSFISAEKFTKNISKYNSIPIITYLFSELGINDETYQDEISDTSELSNKQGKYFQLKNKFGDISKLFVGKDLRSVNLSNIDLKEQDLTGANLSGHDLRNVDFSDTIIRGANLSNTNLQGKDLSGMDLRGINFMNANLKNVNFIEAIFSKPVQFTPYYIGHCNDENPILNIIKNFACTSVVIKNESVRTNFSNTDLTNAKFGNMETKKEQMIYFANFTNANLSNVNLYNVQFFGGDFTNAKLNSISGKLVSILESDFTNSEMKNFEISESWFQSTSFYNADLSNGNFDSITLIDLNFTETELQGTEFILLNEIGDNNYSCKNNMICN